jgi:TonB family protein
MKKQNLLLTVAGTMILTWAILAPGQVKIIANRSVDAEVVSVAELKSVFLEERNSLRNGMHVQPVIQRGGLTHERFARDFLGKGGDELQNYYHGLAFTGTGFTPKQFSTDAEVIAYVSTTKGAIGYVDVQTEAPGAKTLSVMRAGNGAERLLTSRLDPHYPETLRQHAIGGIVRLRVEISAGGSVQTVSLIGGNPILAEAAMEAVRGWKYASAHGSSTMEITIPFDPSH